MFRCWLRQVITGHFAYYAVPTNSRALSAVRHYLAEVWRRTLRRRSQKNGFTWERVTKLVARLASRVAHLSFLADRRFTVNSRGKSRMLESGLSGSARGMPSNGHPYRDPRPERVLRISSGGAQVPRFSWRGAAHTF
jgi:hypothetical protein